LVIGRHWINDFFQPIAGRQVNDQRIEAGSFLCFRDFRDSHRVQRVSSEPVNCFGGERDNFASAQQFNRRGAVD